MLPARHRLSLRLHRHHLLEHGASPASPLLTLVFTPAPTPATPSRIGFIVSKKLSPLAVNRHRLRRRLAAALRPLLSQLRPGFHLLIIPRRATLQSTTSQLTTHFQTLLRTHQLLL